MVESVTDREWQMDYFRPRPFDSPRPGTEKKSGQRESQMHRSREVIRIWACYLAQGAEPELHF
jgi:hypothetical protein